MASKSNLSVVVDIGTSKIVALAGQKNADGKTEILGMVNMPSKGIKRGIVFNIEEAAAAVDLALTELEAQTREKVRQADVAFATQHMRIIEHRGYRFTTGGGMVSQTDMDELYNEARNCKVEQDFKILHIIPQAFVIDEEISELNPVGITGHKIEARFKIVAVPEIHLNKFEPCF